MRDPSKAIGLSSDATDLRIATEDLAMELRIKRPELVKKSSRDRYREVFHHVSIAQYLLNYHAAMAADEPLGTMMEIQDSLMAKNIGHIVECERHKGKILIFAHNSHLQRSKAVWPWFEFWPVGSHLDVIFGSRYAVIGSALGVSDENGIAEPKIKPLKLDLHHSPNQGVSSLLTKVVIFQKRKWHNYQSGQVSRQIRDTIR
jgi:erythromycin esterase